MSSSKHATYHSLDNELATFKMLTEWPVSSGGPGSPDAGIGDHVPGGE